MTLASIINVWDGAELLPYAIRSVEKDVDIFIIVWQDISNYGEKYDPFQEITAAAAMFPHKKFVYKYYEPIAFCGAPNEINKRNVGLQTALEYECTHFFFQDTDELYENFHRAKHEYIAAGTAGSVCRLLTYFKLPILRFELYDSYYVPFIHELHRDTSAGKGDYPYYVDPTRKVRCESVTLITEPMHHFSYVRKDIGRKLRNSSAKANIAKSTVWQDYTNAAPGYYVKPFFEQKLVEVENIFDIEV